MVETTIPTLDHLTPVPEGATFNPIKIERIAIPHPYCITPKHVAVASDHHCGILGVDAIEHAERLGAECDICRKAVRAHRQDKVLLYNEHENLVTLFIEVPQNSDLNAIPGLHSYLMGIKHANIGIEGFAFPLKRE